MRFVPTPIDCVWIVETDPFVDERGQFARAYCAHEFAQNGLEMEILQSSLAWTRFAGTVRGLHYQDHPHWEAKLVRCVRGSAYVVAVDLRTVSPTHRRWHAVELTADNRRGLYVGIGCAQGYQTIVDDTELLYQMSTPYVPSLSRGYRYDDPAFSVNWPLPAGNLSEKDRNWERYRW